MRIAHLSDLHLSPEFHPERTDAFYAILQKCRDLKADHIVITGDITNQAKPKEFTHARGILKEFGLLDPEKLTVTIGNHDIFGGPYFAEDVLSFPGFCRKTDYEAKVKEFTAAFRETFENCKYVAGERMFPFVKILRSVALVGINSVAEWSALKNPLGSNGEVRKHQLKHLQEIFNGDFLKDKTVFVLLHHHFNKPRAHTATGRLERLWNAIEASTMKLWKKKRVISMFKHAAIARVLHGHLHRHETYHRKSVHFMNAGGTMLTDAKGVHRFHLLRVSSSGIEQTDVRVVPSVAKGRMSARA